MNKVINVNVLILCVYLYYMYVYFCNSDEKPVIGFCRIVVIAVYFMWASQHHILGKLSHCPHQHWKDHTDSQSGPSVNSDAVKYDVQ